jgi:hypothetical protein
MLKWLTGDFIVNFWIMMSLEWVVTSESEESAAFLSDEGVGFPKM